MNEEQRKAASERMKAMHAKKRAEKEAARQNLNTFIDEKPVETVLPDDYETLKRQVAEMGEMLARMNQTQQTARINPMGGSLVGRIDKFVVDPANYPNPCDRLSHEPRLQRFAFTVNYELDFQVSSTSYTTKENINMREPKFTLELRRVVIDEATGEPTNGRYVLCRAIFHEDPEAAIVIARDNGIEIDQTNEKLFLDEMRYLRMRDWLIGAFYPPNPSAKKNKKEVVIGNRLVEFFEISSENSEEIPFNELSKKL